MSQNENHNAAPAIDAAPAIKAWRFPSTYTVLIAITAVVWLLTWVIPAGHYQSRDGRPVAGSFQVTASPLTTEQHFKELFLAPVNGLYGIENSAGHVGPYENGSVFGAIGVFFYVLSLGAFIVTTTKTGAIDACLRHVAERFRLRGGLLIGMVMLLIAIGGSTYGMGEETLGFYALLVPLLLGLGFDRMTAVGVILVGSVVGNMNSTVNPFMTGAASAGAGVPMGTGIGLRFIMFIVLTGIAIAYVVIYARRVQKNAKHSVVGFTDEDREMAKPRLQLPQPMTGQQKAVMFTFAGTFCLMIFAIIPWAQVIVGPQAASWPWQLDWYFPELTALFLVMSAVTGIIGGLRSNALYNAMLAGIADFMGAALVIMLARGITVIMHNAQITDTVLHSMESVVSGASSGLFAIIMYLIIMPLSFLVPSSSGLATLAMPVLAPIADFTGVGREIVVTAFQGAVGTIAMISPTSAIVMSGLALAKVSYPRYLMWVLPLLLILAVTTCLFLAIGATLF